MRCGYSSEGLGCYRRGLLYGGLLSSDACSDKSAVVFATSHVGCASCQADPPAWRPAGAGVADARTICDRDACSQALSDINTNAHSKTITITNACAEPLIVAFS